MILTTYYILRIAKNTTSILLALPVIPISIWILWTCDRVIEMVKLGMYEEAKVKLLPPIVASFLLTSRIGGILLLLGYLMI